MNSRTPAIPDPAEILQRLYVAGFDIRTFDQFPRAVGISKGDCIALLEPDASARLRIVGRPGWRIAEAIGVLTTQDGRSVFQWKSQSVEATSERLKMLQEFERELRAFLSPGRSWQVGC